MYARTYYIILSEAEFPNECRDVGSHVFLPERSGVEVAVDAAGLAEREMNVN
jgi:hypothetical protein